MLIIQFILIQMNGLQHIGSNMQLTANGITIPFFDFDMSAHDKILLSLSGGADSAVLFHLACIALPDKEIIPFTGIDIYRPTNIWFAEEIYEITKEKFPNVNIADLQTFKFDMQDPKMIEVAKKLYNKDIHPPFGGYVKNQHMGRNIDQLRIKHNCNFEVNALTANPPVEEQIKFGFDHVAERRRNVTNSDPFIDTVKRFLYKPFINVDKKFIAELYKQYDLMDDIFPITQSCVGREHDTEYWTKPCKKCFWCHEKKWAFGCYDGGEC
jgi:hypothetical protein